MVGATIQRIKAEAFRALHHKFLLLPNAWDATSAKLFEKSGAKAIGTTSAGIANCLGFADGQRIPKTLFLMMVERIIQSVDLPVSVDIEGGFGTTVEEVCETVEQVMKLGAVGINLEDFDFSREGCALVDLDLQVAKISAIRQLAERQEIPLFINARTDVYWHRSMYSDSERDDEGLKRLMAYQEAGASGLFVPGLTELPLIQRVCKAVLRPVNLLGGAWVSAIDDLRAIGVKRISVGSGLFRANAASLENMASMVLAGNLKALGDGIPYDTMNSLFDSQSAGAVGTVAQTSGVTSIVMPLSKAIQETGAKDKESKIESSF